jgi:hypothetical protein
MISPETLTTAKLSIAAISIGLIAFKSIAILQYNRRKEDEPIDFNLFGRFSNMEIDGSYSSKRRSTLMTCNRLTSLFYLCILAFIAVMLIPMMAAKLGIV